MHESLKVRVAFAKLSLLDQAGGESETVYGLYVHNDADSDTVYNQTWKDVSKITPSDVSRQLKMVSNQNLQSYIAQAQGFYLYNVWYTIQSSNQASKNYTSVPYKNINKPNDIWYGTCSRCGIYERVRYYNERPHCSLCIMTMENRKKGKLDSDK